MSDYRGWSVFVIPIVWEHPTMEYDHKHGQSHGKNRINIPSLACFCHCLCPHSQICTFTAFCQEHFYTPRGIYWEQRTPLHSKGESANPFIFQRFYLEPTQGILPRTYKYSMGFISNPSRRFYLESLYTPRVSSRTHSGGSTANFFLDSKGFYLEPTQRTLPRTFVQSRGYI